MTSLRGRLRDALAVARGAKAVAEPEKPTGDEVPDWLDWLIGHPFIPMQRLTSHRDAYRKVPIVQAATGRIQHDVAALDRHVYKGRGAERIEIERQDGNLPDLLFRANPRDTGYQLMVDTVGSLVIAGNAYWFLQRNRSQDAVSEVWCLPAHEVSVEPGRNRGIGRYLYGEQLKPMDPRNVIHFRDYTPDDEPIGMSRIEPVWRDVEAQFYALIWLKEFWKKGAMVSGIWNVKTGDGAPPLSDEKVKAIKKRLNRLHVGYDKAFDAVVVEGLEFIQRGMTLSEMEIDLLLGVINGNICRAIGVPPVMMGIKEGGGLSDAGASTDLKDYWLGTIQRMTRLIDTTITERLCPLFGPDLSIETDMSQVLAIQNVYLEQAKSLVVATGRAVMTANEARQRLGLAPTAEPDDDLLYIKPEPLPGFGVAAPALARRLALAEGNPAREELRRKRNVDLTRYEARIATVMRSVFEQQHARVRSWLEQSGKASQSRIALIAVPVGRIPLQVPEDEAQMEQLILSLVSQRGAEALAEIGLEIEFNVEASAAGEFVRSVTRRLFDDVNGTTTTAVRDAVAKALEGGGTLADAVSAIDEVFASAAAYRAPMIARTEGTRAYNYAAQEAWTQSGVVDGQEWMTARDGRGGRHSEDPAYAGLDGQVAALDGAFQVGGSLLRFPGDPMGPAGETVNCRCTLLPVINEGLARDLKWRSFMAGAERNGKPAAVVAEVMA